MIGQANQHLYARPTAGSYAGRAGEGKGAGREGRGAGGGASPHLTSQTGIRQHDWKKVPLDSSQTSRNSLLPSIVVWDGQTTLVTTGRGGAGRGGAKQGGEERAIRHIKKTTTRVPHFQSPDVAQIKEPPWLGQDADRVTESKAISQTEPGPRVDSF